MISSIKLLKYCTYNAKKCKIYCKKMQYCSNFVGYYFMRINSKLSNVSDYSVNIQKYKSENKYAHASRKTAGQSRSTPNLACKGRKIVYTILRTYSSTYKYDILYHF